MKFLLRILAWFFSDTEDIETFVVSRKLGNNKIYKRIIKVYKSLFQIEYPVINRTK